MTPRQDTIFLVFQGTDKDPGQQQTLPFGILYVGKALKNAGYKVRIFHLLDDQERMLVDEAHRERPLFVGFSNFISPLIAHDIRMSRALHELGVKVVWGGVFPTTLPEVALESGFVDYVVTGEGERAAVSLAEAIREGETPRGIPGVGYKDNGEIVLQPQTGLEQDLDRFEFGLDLINPSDYVTSFKNGAVRYFNLPFSRGCPFQCAFCYNSFNPDRTVWRVHSAEYMKEITSRIAREYGANVFFLICDNAFGKVRKAQAVIESLQVRWGTSVHLTAVNRDFLEWARDCGCVRFGFGVESGSDRMLKLMNKNITREAALEKIRLCGEIGIHSASSFITLMPGETMEDRRKTLTMMDEVFNSNPIHETHLNLFKAYPRTIFWKDCLDLGFKPPSTLEEWGPYEGRINTLMGVSDRRADRLWSLANSLYPKDRTLKALSNPMIRPMLVRRLQRAEMGWPVEEAISAGHKLKKAIRKLV